MSSYIGEIAALSTSICWALTSTLFTISGKYIGSINVNRLRLIFALIFLLIVHTILKGEIIPFHIEGFRWLCLGLSGIIGLILGDGFLFQAFVLVGAHISMLIMSLVPIFSTIIAWLVLGETLIVIKILAIFIAIGGIITVVLSKKDIQKNTKNHKYGSGILFGVVGAISQATGLIIAKIGLAGNFSELSGTLIRVSVATFTIWLFTFVTGKTKRVFTAIKNKKAILVVAIGSFIGPFLGIWLSMIAIKLTYIGVASTLMSLPPIILLPISRWIFKEKITILSVVGTFFTILGIAVIFLT